MYVCGCVCVCVGIGEGRRKVCCVGVVYIHVCGSGTCMYVCVYVCMYV